MDGTERGRKPENENARWLATPIALERHYVPERDAMVAALRVALGWGAQEWTEPEP